MFKERSWKKWLLPGILVIALVGSLIWGYQEMKIRQKLQNRAEGQYQKAFHELFTLLIIFRDSWPKF